MIQNDKEKSKMTIKEQITAFNAENHPFYIVDHDNGNFSLCLAFSFLKGDLADYGQAAFDAYAREIGQPERDKQGFCTYGSGYEWDAAFKEAFKDDPNISQIHFDSESGSFFCDCTNLSVLMDFGTRFKAIVDDTERFTKIVSDGIKADAQRQQAYEAVRYKIKGRLMDYSDFTFHIRTVQGDIRLTPGDIRDLLNGDVEHIRIGNETILAKDFLMQDAYRMGADLFNPGTYQLITDEALKLQEAQYEIDEQVMEDTQQM